MPSRKEILILTSRRVKKLLTSLGEVRARRQNQKSEND